MRKRKSVEFVLCVGAEALGGARRGEKCNALNNFFQQSKLKKPPWNLRTDICVLIVIQEIGTMWKDKVCLSFWHIHVQSGWRIPNNF